MSVGTSRTARDRATCLLATQGGPGPASTSRGRCLIPASLTGASWAPAVGLTRVSPMISGGEHLFIGLLAVRVCSSETCPFRSFTDFQNGLSFYS